MQNPTHSVFLGSSPSGSLVLFCYSLVPDSPLSGFPREGEATHLLAYLSFYLSHINGTTASAVLFFFFRFERGPYVLAEKQRKQNGETGLPHCDAL